MSEEEKKSAEKEAQDEENEEDSYSLSDLLGDVLDILEAGGLVKAMQKRNGRD